MLEALGYLSYRRGSRITRKPSRPTADDLEKRAAKHVPDAPPDSSLAQRHAHCRHCSTIAPASTTAAPPAPTSSPPPAARLQPAPPSRQRLSPRAPSNTHSTRIFVSHAAGLRSRSRAPSRLAEILRKHAEHQRPARLQYKRLMTALPSQTPVTRPSPPLTVSEALHPGIGASLLYSFAL